jgi:outer membrane protein W
MLSNNGLGLGLFYRHDLTEDVTGTINFLISDVKDDAEVENFDIYGQPLIYGKKNRLLMMPLTLGVQYRLFREEIADNFRPYVSAGAGPTMIFVAPYARLTTTSDGFISQEPVEFFSSLKYGQMHFTYGGYLGAGAYFGIERSTISGLNVRYYYVPFPRGIEVMDQTFVKRFGGLYISLQFGAYF